MYFPIEHFGTKQFKTFYDSINKVSFVCTLKSIRKHLNNINDMILAFFDSFLTLLKN